jgi:sugar lactone lactonase YvrE
MKHILKFALIFSFHLSHAEGTSQVNAKWTLKDGVAAPESTYFDSTSGFIFISNISGEGTAKDGKGWIQKVSTNGKIIRREWVSGLHAPKGMRAHKGVLWVTDIDSLIAIDIKSGKILKQIPKPGAKFLNDIAISSSGDVFVSDTLDRKIYRLKNNQLELFFAGDETESPNGLLVHGDKLIVAAWGLAADDWSTTTPGRLYSIDLNSKTKTLITKEPLGNLDGLEIRSNGNYLVSDWSKGRVFEISPDGKIIIILDIGEKGAADIGYISATDSLIVPRMISSQIDFYQLSELAHKAK